MLKRIFSVLLVFGISHAVLCSAQPVHDNPHNRSILPASSRIPHACPAVWRLLYPIRHRTESVAYGETSGTGLSGRTWSACSGERNIRRHILRAG